MGQISKNGQESQSLRWIKWVILLKWSEESKSQMDGMIQIGENGRKCQHVRWIEWVRLDKWSKESKCQMDWMGHIR